jgi:septal ring factor EnvC (AmiA/AmiB activator)
VELEETRDQHIQALVLKENETRKLENDIVQKRQVATNLKAKESELLAKLSKQKQERAELQQQIQKIIEAEIAKKGGKKDTKMPLTPEEQLISDDFELNKGKLPWPVARGQITERYGRRQHPDLQNVIVDNKGINIACQEGEIVRCVFDGVVAEVIQLPKSKAVLIRHGDYFTLYNHLSEIFVSKDQKVETKTKIGVVSTDKNTNETDLQFQVWKSRVTQNPETWITK